jgi:hypothetical protein
MKIFVATVIPLNKVFQDEVHVGYKQDMRETELKEYDVENFKELDLILCQKYDCDEVYIESEQLPNMKRYKDLGVRINPTMAEYNKIKKSKK